MDETSVSMESLYEKARAYTDTSLELAKLKVVEKSSDLLSSLIPRLAILLIILIVLFCLNIGLALWLGVITGRSYYGFLLVAGFYTLLALILHFFFRQRIKKRIATAFITNLFE